jgi:ADP-ribosylglycohydrolase
MNIPTEDQYSRCLIGQCLGDALGFPIEGASQAKCVRYVREVLRTDQVFEQRRGPFRFGQFSDDSQLARELLLSYIHQGDFDPEDYAKRIAAIFAEGRIVGRGRATQQAAYRLMQGVPWDQAGTPPPNAGNGSAMRAGPVGLLFWNDTERLIRAAHDQGRITYHDPRCGGGCVTIAGAVALVVQQGDLDIPQFLGQLSSWSRSFDPIIADALESMTGWLELSQEEAFQKISFTGLAPEYRPSLPMITPFVTTSVLWSIYSFLRHPDDYLDAVSTAISAGGDVDTTAAMTGVISGARLGLNRLPLNLAVHLNDQGDWRYDDLVDLARQVYRLAMKPYL